MKACVVAAFVLLCPHLASADEARLGPLTLGYDPALWQVDGSTIRCLADGCDGTAVEVAVVEDGGDGCSRDAMYRAAPAAFPDAPRHAVNPHVIGNLVLYLGTSSYELGFDAGRAVRACVANDGVAVHFTSRVDGGWPDAGHAGLFHELLRQGLRGAPGVARELVLGDLVIPFLSDAWEVRRRSAAEWDLACLPPACPPDVQVRVSVRPAGTDGCPALPDEGPWQVDRIRVAARDGLVFTMDTIDPMCRMLTASFQVACATHGDLAYVFETPSPVTGCGSGPEVPAAVFRELVESVGLTAGR